MAAKRFKQQVPDEDPYQRGSVPQAAGASGADPRPSVRRASHAAEPQRAARRRFSSPDVSVREPADSAAPVRRAAAPDAQVRRAAIPDARANRPVSAPRHGSRFADASRATASAHRFPHLGGTHDIHLAPGEAPVTASAGDEPSSFSTDDAPRPIGVDPSETGSFSTIGAQSGAVISDRTTAARAAKAARKAMPASERRRVRAFRRRGANGSGVASKAAAPSRPMVIGIGAAALVVIVLFVVLARSIISPSAPADVADTAAATTAENVSTDQGVSLGGYTYSVSQVDGTWSLMRDSGDSSDGSAVAIVALSGTPVSVSLHQDTLLVAENLPDGTWDVISYVAADGSTASQLLGSDGQPVSGQGELASSVVDGSSLVLTDTSGTVTTVPLA